MKDLVETNLTRLAVIFVGILSILTFFFAVNTRAMLINEVSDMRQLLEVISLERIK